MVKNVLFFMSNTGGGHRAAAEAIRDALFVRHGSQNINVQMVDVFKHSLFPLNYMPELYPHWIQYSKSSWGLGYNLSNTRRRARVLSRGMYLTSGPSLRRMVRSNPADVVVCVHSVVARPSLSALLTLDRRPPFITVVTDLVSTHMFWYDTRAEHCFVPTQEAYTRGLECGLRPDQMSISGLPVNPSFNSGLLPKAEARRELGWDPDLPAVLLVGGGEGMGPLYDIARAVNARQGRFQLVIIAGKNSALKARLEAAHWNHPTHIYGFVNDMARKMSAADILVTKAGPSTICEAGIAGLPMILSDAIPGQETGNVEYVVRNGAGVYAPGPDAVAASVSAWLAEGPAGLERRSARTRALGRPDAVWQIADMVWEQAHRAPISTRRRPMFDMPADFDMGKDYGTKM
ncbi:MAG: MGDG synthase family glycosyltransferase [Phototrophicaceae bacterium]